MKMKYFMILTAVCLALTPVAALAGVVNSSHDLVSLYAYPASLSKQGTCSFCHVPHKAQGGGERLFPAAATAPTAAGETTWTSDTLSNICYYCHNGASTYTSAREVMPFRNTSHLRALARLTNGNMKPTHGGDPADVGTLPTDLEPVGTDLRCTSCHDIHNNVRKPFLRWGSNGDFSALAASGFCGKCHPNRNATAIGTASTGLHPARNTYVDNGANSPLITLSGVINVPITNIGAQGGGGWNLGAHMLWSATASTNTFTCGTCHMVHGNETSIFSSTTDGTTPVTDPTGKTAPGDPLLPATDVVNGVTGTEAVCSLCHSIAAGIDARGPGGANTYSHPTGTASVLATTMVAGSRGYKWGLATNNVIVCQSCHDMHFSATNNTGAAATWDASQYLLASDCAGCHALSSAGLTNHHPSSVNVTAGMYYTNTTSSSIDWLNRTKTADAAVTYGLPGIMDCMTCHGRGSAGAHNNPSSVGFPGLTGPNNMSQMCVDCHSFNPSLYTGHNTTGLGSHYVGSISTAGAGYKKTTVWTGAGYTSKWGTAAAGNGFVICESCHSLWVNGRNGHTVTYQLSNNTVDNDSTTEPSLMLMVRVSGNNTNYTAVDGYMCTGCHGASPGGSGATTVSHPTLPTQTWDTTSTLWAAPVPGSFINGNTVGAGARLNCESCHRPHDAATASGTTFSGHNYILESATAATGYVNTSGLCSLCHTGY